MSTKKARFSAQQILSSFSQLLSSPDASVPVSTEAASSTHPYGVFLMSRYSDPNNWFFQIAAVNSRQKVKPSLKQFETLQMFIAACRLFNTWLRGREHVQLIDGLTEERVFTELLQHKVIRAYDVPDHPGEVEYMLVQPEGSLINSVRYVCDLVAHDAQMQRSLKQRPRATYPWNMEMEATPAPLQFDDTDDASVKVPGVEVLGFGEEDLAALIELHGEIMHMELEAFDCAIQPVAVSTARPSEDHPVMRAGFTPVTATLGGRQVFVLEVSVRNGEVSISRGIPRVLQIESYKAEGKGGRTTTRFRALQDGKVYQEGVGNYRSHHEHRVLFADMQALDALPLLASPAKFLTNVFVNRPEVLAAFPALAAWAAMDTKNSARLAGVLALRALAMRTKKGVTPVGLQYIQQLQNEVREELETRLQQVSTAGLHDDVLDEIDASVERIGEEFALPQATSDVEPVPEMAPVAPANEPAPEMAPVADSEAESEEAEADEEEIVHTDAQDVEHTA